MAVYFKNLKNMPTLPLIQQILCEEIIRLPAKVYLPGRGKGGISHHSVIIKDVQPKCLSLKVWIIQKYNVHIRESYASFKNYFVKEYLMTSECL